MKKFLTALVASVVSLSPTGAMAGNNNIDEHQQLWDTLSNIGVITLVNDARYCEKDVMGLYYPYQRTLVVCQEKARVNNGRMVEWTDEDLDTLRHEAHHVVQDCLDRNLGDGHLAVLFDGPDQLREFYTGILSQRQINWIVSTYTKNGGDSDVIKLELEAFAVAQGVGPVNIANALNSQCSVRPGFSK